MWAEILVLLGGSGKTRARPGRAEGGRGAERAPIRRSVRAVAGPG